MEPLASKHDTQNSISMNCQFGNFFNTIDKILGAIFGAIFLLLNWVPGRPSNGTEFGTDFRTGKF